MGIISDHESRRREEAFRARMGGRTHRPTVDYATRVGPPIEATIDGKIGPDGSISIPLPSIVIAASDEPQPSSDYEAELDEELAKLGLTRDDYDAMKRNEEENNQ